MKKVLFLWPMWADKQNRKLCFSEDSQRIFETVLQNAGLKDHVLKHAVLHDGQIARGKKPPIKSCRLVWQELVKSLDADVVVPVGSVSFQTVLGNDRKISVWGGRLITDAECGRAVFGVMHPDQVSYTPAASRELTTQLNTLSSLLSGSQSEKKTTAYELVTDASEAASVFKALSSGVVAFDYETTGLDVYAPDFKLRTVSLCAEAGFAHVIDFESCGDAALQSLKEWLLSPAVKVAHNAKYEARVGLKLFRVLPKNLQCTMLLHHLVDEESGHGLDVLASAYTDLAGYDTDLLKKLEEGYTWSNVPIDVLAAYNATDADVTLQSYNKLRDAINQDRNKDDLLSFYQKFARPMLYLLTELEHNGMWIGEKRLADLEQELSLQIEEAKKKLALDERAVKTAALLGLASVDALNLKSPAHTSKLLFEVAGLQPATLTKTGAASTSDLDGIDTDDALVALVVDVRSCLHDLSVLKELKANVREECRVCSDFFQPGTVTWRLASKKPPLQNLPRNGRVKSVFTSRWRDGAIIQADFSQLEVRILGNLAGDPKFEHAFASGYDFHTYTASQIFQVPLEKVTKEQRNSAKRVNFGVIFGIGPKKLASQIGCEFMEAKKLLDDFFVRYKHVGDWVEDNRKSTTRFMRAKSEVGQIRRLKDVRHPDQFVRWRAQRQGVNFLIAAFGAAMTQFAMLQIRAEMKKHNLRSVLVGQVHDSIIIDSPPQETSFCGQLLHECMTKRTQAAYPVLRIPLKADVTCGPSYGEQDLSINETGEITRHS